MRFGSLLNHRALIRDNLLSISRKRHLACMGHDFSTAINIHIRMGDFSQPDCAALAKGKTNMRLPLQWYAHVVSHIQNALGDRVVFNVFSDGRDSELAELLKMKNVRRMRWGSSLADMWALSRAKLIIASGSTFSNWARFLGGCDCIAYPNQIMERGLAEGGQAFEYEVGVEEALPERVSRRLAALYPP